MLDVPGDMAGLEEAAALERASLVRLCARITGDVDAAEDLAQETLLEAWRSEHKLRDPEARPRWLAGIARNVCLRWAHHRRREPRLIKSVGVDGGPAVPRIEDLPADDFDLEVELERDELATLLDRALALLPYETRDVLVQRYVEESPHAEIAARLGLTEDAVSMRLTRGKLALRRLLTTELKHEAAPYGLNGVAAEGWQQTRIWCPRCGRQRLLAHVQPPPGTVSFRCPACAPNPEVIHSGYRLANPHFARLIGGLTRPKTILRRTSAWAHDYYRRAIEERSAICTSCGRPAQLHLALHQDTPATLDDPHLVYVSCEACGEDTNASLDGLAESLPQVQRFWREHSRIHALPVRELEIDGRCALVAGFETVAGTARLDVIIARDSLRLIGVHGDLVHEQGR